MSEGQDRQMPITQIDELWAIAEKRWGSAGRRTPPPDPRFSQLREYLGKIEGLFSKDKENRPGLGESIKRPKRKINMAGDADSIGDYDDEEIPF